ncbi:MAG: ABC transporter transmembrane domain-containing protein, partial [Sulfitobacter geojensis]
MTSLHKISDWINPFAKADGPPPQTLGAFIRWSLNGAWAVLFLAAFLSALAGAMEAGTAWILGRVIDASISAGPEAFFDGRNIGLILGAIAFFLIARPVLFGLSSGANAIMVAPNVNPLVLSRLHRWTLGQNVGFFDDDFAGRIAQKQMQTSRAVTDVAVEMINVVAFALASLAGSVALLVAIDWRVAVGFAFWLVGYFALIRWFLPRVRMRSAARAGAKAMVSGQVVDTITNIKTVKLFAHADHEDRAALGAMRAFRQRALEFGFLAAGFRFALMSLAGVLPVLLIGGTILLWQRGIATEGDIVASGAVAIRIAQMTGWVSFTLMAVYSNVGEIEDGMKTLTPRNRVDDLADAPALDVPSGKIEMRNLSFAYGRQSGGIEGID